VTEEPFFVSTDLFQPIERFSESAAQVKSLCHLALDYPIRPEPRYGSGKPGHPQLAAILAQRDEAYRKTLGLLAGFSKPLAQIAESSDDGAPGEPCWANIYFSALDAIALYGPLGSGNPSRYVEIGSGNSTKFARRAVRDLGLKTTITSLDPCPRAEVDALCDRVIRQPLECADIALFEELEAGDVVFLDGSHRVFMNSDATVFFLEVLPRLKSGVRVHVHDVFLPFDYPAMWACRHYSEQYVLAAYLLAGGNRFGVLLPLAYLGCHSSMAQLIDRICPQAVFQRAFSHYRRLTGGYIATSFWLDVN
jgi:hypothetical protein